MGKADRAIGKRYGHLIVVGIERRDSKSRAVYRCQCDCGNTSFPRIDYLNRAGSAASCGCRHGKSWETRTAERKENSRRRYIENQERATRAARSDRLKKKYGITIEKYDQMLREQGERCAICSVHQNSIPKIQGRLVVDHCHSTGQVRRLLCKSCNTGLGMFRESIDFLTNAINYLSMQRETAAESGI